MRRILAVGLMVAGLSLGGCATTSGGVTDTPTAGVNRPDAVSSSVEDESDTSKPEAPSLGTRDEGSAPTDEESEPTDEEEVSVLKFGQTYRYEDGLQIKVSKPWKFKPGKWAFGGDKFKSYRGFTVTIVNGTKKPFKPSLFHADLQSANEEADQVYDAAQLGQRPSTTLLPKREAKFKIAFGIADPSDLVLEVSPGSFEYDDAIFTS